MGVLQLYELPSLSKMAKAIRYRRTAPTKRKKMKYKKDLLGLSADDVTNKAKLLNMDDKRLQHIIQTMFDAPTSPNGCVCWPTLPKEGDCPQHPREDGKEPRSRTYSKAVVRCFLNKAHWNFVGKRDTWELIALMAHKTFENIRDRFNKEKLKELKRAAEPIVAHRQQIEFLNDRMIRSKTGKKEKERGNENAGEQMQRDDERSETVEDYQIYDHREFARMRDREEGEQGFDSRLKSRKRKAVVKDENDEVHRERVGVERNASGEDIEPRINRHPERSRPLDSQSTNSLATSKKKQRKSSIQTLSKKSYWSWPKDHKTNLLKLFALFQGQKLDLESAAERTNLTVSQVVIWFERRRLMLLSIPEADMVTHKERAKSIDKLLIATHKLFPNPNKSVLFYIGIKTGMRIEKIVNFFRKQNICQKYDKSWMENQQSGTPFNYKHYLTNKEAYEFNQKVKDANEIKCYFEEFFGSEAAELDEDSRPEGKQEILQFEDLERELYFRKTVPSDPQFEHQFKTLTLPTSERLVMECWSQRELFEFFSQLVPPLEIDILKSKKVTAQNLASFLNKDEQFLKTLSMKNVLSPSSRANYFSEASIKSVNCSLRRIIEFRNEFGCACEEVS